MTSIRICLTALVVFALLMTGALLLERAYHYEQCVLTYEDGSSYNQCNHTSKGVPW